MSFDASARGQMRHQPCLNRLRRRRLARPIRLRGFRRHLLAHFMSLNLLHPLPDDLQASRQKSVAARAALNLAARGLRNVARPEKRDAVNFQFMAVRDSLANRVHDLLRLRTLKMTPDLDDDGQPLLALDLDGEGRADALSQSSVTLFGCPLDGVRVVIAAPDNNQVFKASGDEQLAVLEEAQITRA